MSSHCICHNIHLPSVTAVSRMATSVAVEFILIFFFSRDTDLFLHSKLIVGKLSTFYRFCHDHVLFVTNFHSRFNLLLVLVELSSGC